MPLTQFTQGRPTASSLSSASALLYIDLWTLGPAPYLNLLLDVVLFCFLGFEDLVVALGFCFVRKNLKLGGYERGKDLERSQFFHA